jgi:hypothetical protein
VKAALFLDRAAFLFVKTKGEKKNETDNCFDRNHADAAEPVRL